MTNKENDGILQNIKLSEQQKEIINSNIDEDQRILACAGSGKTTTLIYRIKHLIDLGIEANQILLSTFNVEAAYNLKMKAKQVIPEQAESVKIMNIDKFIADIYEKFIKKKVKDNKFKLDVKEYGYKAQEFLSTMEGQENVLKKYKYFFFDEFQDVNQIQYDIILLFKRMGSKIIVIGDEAQNIYGFRDSQLEFIQSKIVKDVLEISKYNIKTYRLNTNFRCSSQITNFCNQIFANQQGLHQKMESLKKDQNNSLPEIYLYNNQDEQGEQIIKKLENLNKNFQWSDLAILSPTRQPLRYFQEILEKHNSSPTNTKIPYSLRFKSLDNLLYYENFEATEKQNSITLSTIHASKGLEWKIVFIIGVNDQNFPGAFINQLNEEDIQEKLSECRRFFYVACTRAMEQLNFSFIKQPKKFICRFFSEIEEKYYFQGSGFDKQQIVQSKQKNSQFFASNCKNNISNIIQNFEQSDYEQVNNFLQQIKFNRYSYGLQATFNGTTIKQNNLQQDLICFLDVLLYRTIAEKFLKAERFQNEDAERILVTINWNRNQQQKIIYNKYKEFFNNKSLNFEKLKSYQEFIQNLNDYYKNDQQADQKESKILQNMFSHISEFLKKNKPLKYKDICHTIESRSFYYFPENFEEKQKFIESYLNFTDKTKNTQNIIKDVYNVSKCNLISQGIRRSLYRDDQLTFYPWDLKFNIGRFLDTLKQYKQHIIKKKVEYEDLNGVVDLIAYNSDGADIFQFIYSEKNIKSQNISKHQLIQLLVYAVILKKKGENIKNIVFYNLLQEDLIYYSIEEWNQDEEFLKFMQKKKQDYIKNQEENQETDNSSQQEDSLEVQTIEKDILNQQIILEEAKEDNILSNNFKNGIQENQEIHNIKLYQQFNFPYSRKSTQNLSQNSDEIDLKQDILSLQNKNDLEGNIEREIQLIRNQSLENEDQILPVIDGQQIIVKDQFEQEKQIIDNSQQKDNGQQEIENTTNQQINLKNIDDQDSKLSTKNNKKKLKKSKIEHQRSNLNEKRRSEQNQIEYDQQKICYKKQKIEQGEKAINLQIIFFTIYILFQIMQIFLQYKAINQ
ncbi:hypothetical protein ABPG74_018019 [Tetrahymena malaccensis]